MTALVPDPSSLGLESPAIGPWFSTDVTLPAPSESLGVSVTIPAGTAWLPPATGLLSLGVSATPPPPLLARLRGPSGTPPFTDGRLVLVFRLLPEVETRLGALLRALPPVDGGGASAVPTRATVRTFALELPTLPTLDDVAPRLDPALSLSSDDDVDAAVIGLTVEGGVLGNGPEPMTAFARPGTTLGGAEKLWVFNAETTVVLHAFDVRGRAVDPGAVATWWNVLATTFTNLRAPGVDARTATAAPRLSVHLAAPDEGPLLPHVLARVAPTNLDGTGAVRTRGTATGAAIVALTAGTADDAPLPRAAALPAGTYADTVTLWPSGAVGGIERDFVRVAVVEVEEHLTGQRRVAASGATTPDTRRAADQRRASTRTVAARATTTTGESVLLPDGESAIREWLEVISAGAAQVVAPVIDRSAGALAAPALPEVDPPALLPAGVTVTALTGAGTAEGSTVVRQRVLVTLAFESALSGAWVRVWPQYFDAETGRHVRGAGGAARVDSSGAARAVVRLADGAVAPDNRMGLEVMVSTATRTTRYPEVRFARPAPVGGDPVSLATAGATVLACEMGQEFPGAVPAATLASGSTLVALTSPPTMVDPASIPADRWAAPSVGSAFSTGDTLLVTESAWKGWRGGESAATVAGSGGTAVLRTGLDRLTTAGAPLPTQSRDEVAAAVLTATVAQGCVAAIRPLGLHHELPTHQTGHVGAPADDERHGTGARLRGPAVTPLAEYLRERLAGSTEALATAAQTPLAVPPAPTVAGSWAATLRTVGFGVESEATVAAALSGATAGDFPFDGTFDEIRQWLSNRGVTIPTATGDAAASIVRAVSRRALGTARGYREGATALSRALARAQDFVYLETPALDGLAFGVEEDRVSPWATLVAAAQANPALHVLLCVPTRLAPGAPRGWTKVRDAAMRTALDQVKTAMGARFAAFTPVTGPGRSLHLDATSVVVDDAFALTGGTHLSRRGGSFDASLAVSVFDERLEGGRPAEVVAFRRALIAGRLGLSAAMVPDDPEELVLAVAQLQARGGGIRFSPEAIESPSPAPTEADAHAWNPDGSPTASFQPLAWLLSLSAAVQAELEAEVPGSP